MTEKLSSQMEDAIRDDFGSIVGSFVLDTMPTIYTPDDTPPDFIEALVGVQLPIRGKLNHLYDHHTPGLRFVSDTILEVNNEADHPITVYGFDALAELERIGHVDAAELHRPHGWMKLGFTAAQGTLAPLPRLLAA